VKAEDLMTRNVLTVRADMTLQELAAFLRRHKITGAPVSDGDRVVGVVSLADIARADSERTEEVWDPTSSDYYIRDWRPQVDDEGPRFFRAGDKRVRVYDIMNHEVYSVGPSADVPTMASKMLYHHVHRLLVIDGDQLVGVVTTSDLLRLLAGEPRPDLRLLPDDEETAVEAAGVS